MISAVAAIGPCWTASLGRVSPYRRCSDLFRSTLGEKHVTDTFLLLAVALLGLTLLIVFSKRVTQVLTRFDALERTHTRAEDSIREESARSREESARSERELREELRSAAKDATDSLVKGLVEISGAQKTSLDSFADNLMSVTDTNRQQVEALREGVETRLRLVQEDTSRALDRVRTESSENHTKMREGLTRALKDSNDSLVTQVGHLTESNERKLDELRGDVDARLRAIQEDNGHKLELMRQTVDEKLQGTLDKRLTESFRLVSDRLELVHRGLGEMQTLASGVGDLKRVLSNVKARGNWGEFQVQALLEQILSPEQYASNVATKESSGERVEFAIKLPGPDSKESEPVWLPIDAKFPIEDYQRLLDAADKGDADGVEAAARDLERRIRSSARDISEKYINPPRTTDFSILYLPTEGLYAEVLRREGLFDGLQREYRVTVVGPTTLGALLNSLQMGFRTLAIQKRSSEVWAILGAVKAEFGKFADVLTSVQKKLAEASATIDRAGVRTRAITRKLREVEELPAADARALLGSTERPELDVESAEEQ